MRHVRARPAGASRRRWFAAGGATAILLLAAACGSDDTGEPATTTAAPAATTAAPTTAAAVPADVVELVASDFAFGGLPESVPSGTRFDVTNTSTSELHEFVLFRLADGDSRPVADIVHHDLEATLSSGPPALVILAPPGAEQIVAVGDGALHEPGRYVAVCMIPTGADAQAYLEAAASSGGAPPSVPGGPPHVMQGMFAEVTVV